MINSVSQLTHLVVLFSRELNVSYLPMFADVFLWTMTVHVDDEDDGHWSVCVMRFYFGVLLENHSVVVFQ